MPRYTSYPTAPHFHAGIGPDDLSQLARRAARGHPALALPARPVLPAALLVLRLPHHGRPPLSAGRRVSGSAAGGAGAGRRCSWAAGGPVSHVHFGGGTPTMIAPDDLRTLGERLRERFEILGDAEVAVEIDPRRLTRDTVDALAAIGVNRASLGVQDVNPEVQRAINRWQPFERGRARRGPAARRRHLRHQLRSDVRSASSDRRPRTAIGRGGAAAAPRAGRAVRLRARALDEAPSASDRRERVAGARWSARRSSRPRPPGSATPATWRSASIISRCRTTVSRSRFGKGVCAATSRATPPIPLRRCSASAPRRSAACPRAMCRTPCPFRRIVTRSAPVASPPRAASRSPTRIARAGRSSSA